MDARAADLVVDLSRALEAHDKPRAAALARELELELEGEDDDRALVSLRLLASSFAIFMRTSSRPPPMPARAVASPVAVDPFAVFGLPDVRTYRTSREGPIGWRDINPVLRAHQRPWIWTFHGRAQMRNGSRDLWGLIYAENREHANAHAESETQAAFQSSPDFVRVESVDVRHPGEGLER